MLESNKKLMIVEDDWFITNRAGYQCRLWYDNG